MKGRTLSNLLVLALAVALGAQSVRWLHRRVASHVVRQVEILSEAALAYGQAPVRLMQDNLAKLDKVAGYDSASVDLPIARGTQYLFLARPEEALAWYHEALALEPRPEIYLHLGRALRLLGRQEEARASFATARRLDWRLAAQVPEELR